MMEQVRRDSCLRETLIIAKIALMTLMKADLKKVCLHDYAHKALAINCPTLRKMK